MTNNGFRQKEIQAFWAVTKELQTAMESRKPEEIRLALEEIEGLWRHTTYTVLAERCALILSAHGLLDAALADTVSRSEL